MTTNTNSITLEIFLYLLREKKPSEKLRINSGIAELHLHGGDVATLRDSFGNINIPHGWFIQHPDGFSFLHRMVRAL